MKSFNKFLTESNKTYQFKIGIAGPLPEGFRDDMETCLKKFKVLNMSPGKKTPIQERPLDFPQLQNMEVTYFETELEYPTTSQVLQEYVATCCKCNQGHIIVRNTNDPREEYQEIKDTAPYEAKLTTEEMEDADPGAQDHVGDNRVMELLKELEAVRKERTIDPIDSVVSGES
jgi:hypothetical protein